MNDKKNISIRISLESYQLIKIEAVKTMQPLQKCLDDLIKLKFSKQKDA